MSRCWGRHLPHPHSLYSTRQARYPGQPPAHLLAMPPCPSCAVRRLWAAAKELAGAKGTNLSLQRETDMHWQKAATHARD